MTSFWIHPLTIRGLGALALAKAFLAYRSPHRKMSLRHRAEFYDRTWQEAARELGGTWTKLSDDISEINFGGFRTRVMLNTSCIDDPVTLEILGDKPLTHRLLMAEGLPVPRHTTFSSSKMEPAVRFLQSTQRDCVVKPARGSAGGRGITTGIRKMSHLARATARAAVYSDELLIEEQIDGDNYRLLYLDGKLIDSLVRRLPWVTGDGRSSVARLVKQANEQRLRNRTDISQVLISIDLDMHRTLAGQGLALRSVPHKAQRVTLKRVVNENSGADNTTATPMLCQSIIDDGTKAVRALGVRFCGLDILTPSPGLPLTQCGGVVLEANSTPGLYHHYKKADGAFPVATHLLKQIIIGASRDATAQAQLSRGPRQRQYA